MPPLKKRDWLVLAPLIDVLAREARVIGDLDGDGDRLLCLRFAGQEAVEMVEPVADCHIKGAAESIQVVVGVVRATITRRDDVKYMLPLGGISRLELNQP